MWNTSLFAHGGDAGVMVVVDCIDPCSNKDEGVEELSSTLATGGDPGVTVDVEMTSCSCLEGIADALYCL